MSEQLGYEPIESASIDEIRSLQLERMKWSLKQAYDNIDHYNHEFHFHDVHPDDLNSLEDLSRFPLLTKQDLRSSYPFGMFAVPNEQVARIHASSGTTGQPTIVPYTRNDLDVWSTVVARSLYAAGTRPGDMVHVAYGYGLFTGGLGAHYGAEKLGCTVIPVSGGQTEKQVSLMIDLRPRVLMVTPSYCLNLIDEFERRGLIAAEASSIEIGVFGAEPWTDEMRSDIEWRFGIDAVDIYGLSEVIGPGVAQECVETKDGLTIWEDHFYPEIIDPETGEVLPDGEEGELVLTSLTKEAFPVIRYRTRDLARLLPGTARSMRRLGRISGRSDDMLIIRGVNVFPSQVEAEIFKVTGLSPHYQLHVAQDGNMKSLTINVERLPDTDGGSDWAEDRARRLGKHIKDNIGITADVVITEPNTIPRSQGKAQRVVKG
ncbi:MAG: phenylacetate--CoA ligase [Acidimicrobiia bacterium]|nr:phenylacetate--CoA ligase [Acidimicrobiia bacterium]